MSRMPAIIIKSLTVTVSDMTSIKAMAGTTVPDQTQEDVKGKA